MDNNHKRVIVTGGANGIGLATAVLFANKGHHVTIIDSSIKNLEKIKNMNTKIKHYIQADVSKKSEIKKAFKDQDNFEGGTDILIANAGISYREQFSKISYKQWRRVLDTNLNGVFYCSQEAIQRMIKQKNGIILATASTNGAVGHPLYADYNASKGAVISLIRTLAIELAPHIRANAVAPGYVMTDMQRREYSENQIRALNENIPLKRHAEPEEVANLFYFLASKNAEYITGQVMFIDGGESAC